MSLRNLRIIVYGIVLTSLLLGHELYGITAPSSKPANQTKTLKFPDKEIGAVYYIPGMKLSEEWTPAEFKYLGKACRDLTVPVNTPLLFKSDYYLVDHPDLLATVPPDAFVEIDLNRLEFNDSICAPLSKLVSVQRMILAGTDVTDAGLMKFGNLPNLNELQIQGTNVKGAFLSSLSHPEKLHFLKFGDNPLSGKYLSNLPRFRNLTFLDLHHCNITDKALQYVGQMTSVKSLRLYGNPLITDEGLKVLKSMNQLHSLCIQDSKITPDGLIELKSLPLEDLMVSRSLGARNISKLQKIFPATKINITKATPVTPEIEHIFKPFR